MTVYSPESLSDDSLSSPSADSDFLFPGPSEAFSEEEDEEDEEEEDEVDELVFSELHISPYAPSPKGGAREPHAEAHLKAHTLAGGVVEDRKRGEGGEGSGASMASASQPRTVDQERRRFSASELISRLQLSQRKSSFTLKLGKSLSARVASRERQAPRSLSPERES